MAKPNFEFGLAFDQTAKKCTGEVGGESSSQLNGNLVDDNCINLLNAFHEYAIHVESKSLHRYEMARPSRVISVSCRAIALSCRS